MKHVILLSRAQELPAPALLAALREAGIDTMMAPTAAVVTAVAPGPLNGDGGELPPLAVLYEVAAGADIAEIHRAVTHAAEVWPNTPIVACRRNTLMNGHRNGYRLEGAALKRLGFRAVADDPAQLPVLLRELESQDMPEELPLPEDELEPAPASVLLPGRLNVTQLRAAFEAVACLHFATDQKGAAATALAALSGLLPADRWAIYLAGEVGGDAVQEATFEPLAVRGLTESERALPESDWRRSLVGDALALSGAESRAARMAVATAETVRRREGERRVVAVPLIHGERLLGVLEGIRENSRSRAFSAKEAALLSALALPFSAALANSVRIAEAERLSQTDDLTKLHNARFLRQYLISEIKRARRYGSTVTAIFLDLDDFKRINDQHGHLVGSHVLMEMAAVVLTCVRDTDVVARYGGDEFVMILPETGVEQAAHVAARVRECIATHVFTGGRSLRLSLTASFGVATFPEHAQSPQQLIACADAAMYAAKAARKNCIRFAPGQPQHS